MKVYELMELIKNTVPLDYDVESYFEILKDDANKKVYIITDGD